MYDNRSAEEVFEGIDSAAQFKEQARVGGDAVVRPAGELDVRDFPFRRLLFALKRRTNSYSQLYSNACMAES